MLGPGEGSRADEPPNDALEEVDRRIARWKVKGNRAKRTARSGTGIIVVSSALVPIVLLVSTHWSHFFLGKVAPSVLAAIAAAAASWMQFERPYEGWALYRGYQRALETERVRYCYSVSPYEDQKTRDGVLIERLAEYLESFDNEWKAHIPTDAEITIETRRAREIAQQAQGPS